MPPGTDLAACAGRVEARCAAAGLRATLRGTLARCPGCTHWHFKRGVERGTLEITLWPSAGRLWLSIQEGRAAPWVEQAAVRLQAELEELLARESPPEAETPTPAAESDFWKD